MFVFTQLVWHIIEELHTYCISIFAGHYTTCCKSQSCAPEDGQMNARNMLSRFRDQKMVIVATNWSSILFTYVRSTVFRG